MQTAVSGHGTFIYDAEKTIARYGSASLVATALIECDMQHAWVRIHGRTKVSPANATYALVQALRQAKIAVAGWGWCQGEHISMEADLALTALKTFEIEHYIADIEDGVNGSSWSESEVGIFLKSMREAMPSEASLGVSTFGFIPYHKPKLMKAAKPHVDFFAPQVYWFEHPGIKMLKAAGCSQEEYLLNDPSAYVRLCMKVWHDLGLDKPIVVTGQAYWAEDEDHDFTEDIASSKVLQFLSAFNQWDELKGFNWWHMGGKGQTAMNYEMYQAISKAKLNGKF
jgi:hypothetical protein